MKLALQELKATPLTQVIDVNQRITFERIRLHLVKYLSPEGSLKVSFLKGEEEVFSVTKTLAQLQAESSDLSANYYHGLVSFKLDKPFILNPGEYTLKLEATGSYSYSDSQFFGWLLDWDDTVTPTEDIDTSDLPYKYEIYSYQNT